MPRSTDKTPLGKVLSALKDGAGLQRDSLIKDLGPGFQRMLGIKPGDRLTDVRRQVTDEFKRAIKTLDRNKESTRQEIHDIALVNYNIAPYSGSRCDKLKDRLEWLEDTKAFERGGGSPVVGSVVKKTTARNRMRDTILPGLESYFAARWQQFAPGELFPENRNSAPGENVAVKSIRLKPSRKIHKPEVIAREGVPDRRIVAPAPSRLGKPLGVILTVAVLIASVAGGLLWFQPWKTPAVVGALPTSSVSLGSTSSLQPSTSTTQPSSSTAAASPVRVDSVREIQAINQGFTYVFSNKRQFSDAEIVGLNRLEVDPDKYRQWFGSRGGVVSAVSAVQIVVRGAATVTVNIVDMKVVKKCSPYLRGTLFYSPPAGQDDTIYIGFDLSKQLPIAQNLQKGDLSGAYFQEHTISLKPGETHTLLVHAFPGVQYCKLHYELAVSTGEANTVMPVTVDNNGKDFEVTAVPEFDGIPKFPDYPIVYAGGVANPQQTQGYVQVDPATYRGY